MVIRQAHRLAVHLTPNEMNSKKVLIITYYWPPSGGSGVQRWLKFAKYLPQFGWTPYVLTPENPSFTIKDESLVKDIPIGVTVTKLPIWEPYDLFFWFSGWLGKKEMKQSDFVPTGKKSPFQKLSTWIRGNFFIPDARVCWVKPASRFLETFIKNQDIQTVITTGPPHSMHLIGLRLKKNNPWLKWIADFRDPWSEWDLLDALSLSSGSRKKHKKLECQVLIAADKVITIAPYHVQRLESLSGRKVDLITNGFDEDDFRGINKIKTARFTIRHVGIVDELRDPRPVMEALLELCSADADFAGHVGVEFIGNVNSAFKEYVTSIPALNAFTSFVDYLPHQQLLRLYGETDLQLLILAHTAIAPGNLPGKFFEYLASGNPILALGPVQGDAGDVLRQTQAGEIFERSDKEGIKSGLITFYSNWKNRVEANQRNITSLSRSNLTAKLVSILESKE